MVVFNPLIEGVKKYSPPREMMNSGIAKSVCSFNGSRPDIERTPCPMIGSNLINNPCNYPVYVSAMNEDTYPGFSGCVSNGGKFLLFAQAYNNFMQIRKAVGNNLMSE